MFYLVRIINLCYLELLLPNTCQIHQHDPRVDTRCTVERVSSEATVPANFGDLVFGSHCCQLGVIELLEKSPDVVQRPQEKNVRVYVQQGVHILQNHLSIKTNGFI